MLLLTPQPWSSRSYLQALARATIDAECVETVEELEARALDAATPPPDLVVVLSPVADVIDPRALATLMTRLSARPRAPLEVAPPRAANLGEALRDYCAWRGLSPRQARVLELYLGGHHDKQIADLVGCSVATVYEHWRRMARKAEGFHKNDVVTDFHRFLGRNDVAALAAGG